MYGLTRERVRQIKDRALRRLRKSLLANNPNLRPFKMPSGKGTAIGVLAAFGIAFALFTITPKFFHQSTPKTMSPEWKKAEAEYIKQHHFDPISKHKIGAKVHIPEFKL